MLRSLSPHARYRIFQLVYAAAALNFLIPAVSYIVAPELTVQTVNDINLLLGGPAWPAETGQLWHMLAVGNVMTLGFLCVVIGADIVRGFTLLPALLFLKAFSALYSLALGLTVEGVPAFFSVFVLDGGTTLLLAWAAFLGRRAALDMKESDRPVPLWSYILLRPRRVRDRLDAIAEKTGTPSPTLWQMMLWTGHMWFRVIFCTETVGSGGGVPVRSTWRARLLEKKALRVWPLLGARAIAPLDMSGLASSQERVIRHLIGAHHDGQEFAYDLEMLSFIPGGLDELRQRTAAIVDGSNPKAEAWRDLCVFEGYHERLLAGVDAAIAGTLVSQADPDASFVAMLDWARAQPSHPMERTRPTTGESAAI